MTQANNEMAEMSNNHAKLNNRININVAAEFVTERVSDKGDMRYGFSYHVSITNNGSETTQLLNRHWIIKDAFDKTFEVKGEGVIGVQPFIQPGETYEYRSGTLLATPVGTMEGRYTMQSHDGKKFDANIDTFLLAKPGMLN